MKEEVLSLATFTLGALCFVTFLVMIKPMSFGVEESPSLVSYAATQKKRQIAVKAQHYSARRIAHDSGNGVPSN